MPKEKETERFNIFFILMIFLLMLALVVLAGIDILLAKAIFKI